MKDDLSDFGSAGREAPRFRLSIAGLTWELLLVTLVFGVPKARVYFAEYGIDLSFFTILALRASHAVISYAPQLLVFLGAVWLVQDALVARGALRASRTTSAFVLALPLLLIALTLFALGLPFLSIMQKLEG